MRDVIQQHVGSSGRNYDEEAGSEIFCKLLSDLKESSESDRPTLWQANWVEVAWPAGDSLVTKGGERLLLSDIDSGYQWLSEPCLDERDKRTSTTAPQRQRRISCRTRGWKTIVPCYGRCEIFRSVKKASDDVHLADQKFTDLVIVHATDQQLSEAPSKATANLIP